MKPTTGGGAVGRRGSEFLRDLVPPYEYRQGRYFVRFARNEGDVDRCCKLRYEVFNLELGEGFESSHVTRRDRDSYDDQCHHLIVEDVKTGAVVGTYRLQMKEAADAGIGFYSASEYDLSSVPAEILSGMVELGRACTAIEHRTRAVLNLLWRGIATYMLHNRRRYVFGCSSLTSQDPALGLATHRYLLERGYGHPELDIQPLPTFVCESTEDARTSVKLPTLFTLYLRLGARVCGPPAIDRFFGTIDFLTLIDTGTMDQGIFRSYVD